MCQKKPGPRCTTHARRALVAAKKKYTENPIQENYKVLVAKTKDYDSTPGGMKNLQSQIDTLGEQSSSLDRRTKAYRQILDKSNGLQRRLNVGISRRAAMKQAYDDMVARASSADIPKEEKIKYDLPDSFNRPDSDDIGGEAIGYESYYPGCAGCEPSDDEDSYSDDYCRCRSYRQAGSPRISKVLAGAFSCPEKDVTFEIENWAFQNGFGRDSAYDVNITGDYYGDDIKVTIRPELLVKIQEFYDDNSKKKTKKKSPQIYRNHYLI